MTPRQDSLGRVAIVSALVAILVMAMWTDLVRPAWAARVVYTGQAALQRMGMIYQAAQDDDALTNAKALTNASQQYTIPDVKDSAYEICAHGTTAYILAGSNPTATTSVGGYWRQVDAGTCLPHPVVFECVDASNTLECATRKVAYIATATVAGATIEFNRIDLNL